ncbi:Cytochrome c-552/DMSO reductase-like, heme-binding domain protein [Candidatus Magnetomorum sp. HK-1]|nr:Cytochrome c-552/DMSO reductase-like, heme-binding domain protein [Candidatus Magnetomorum sp. HK-1]
MKTKIINILIVSLIMYFNITDTCLSDQTIIAQKVNTEPIIDGIGNDLAWKNVPHILTYDNIADIHVTLKAVYSNTRIYFFVTFDDPDESRIHKAWIWNKNMNIYTIGPEREDTFVFKWNMTPNPVDLSILSDDSYVTDIWFWKANRTDPAGYADDKIAHLDSYKIEKSKKIVSKSGKIMYIKRKGDEGKPSYQSIIYANYQGDNLQNFKKQIPTKSRADIKAKGVWTNGKWTIELGRKLNTGHLDDIQFDIEKVYQFGISRYEIAGRKINPSLTQPLYGKGDVSENLYLSFKR